MPDKPFDPTKPVQTRDGHPARIICTDREGPQNNLKNNLNWPIIALVRKRSGCEMAVSYDASGRIGGSQVREHRFDLVNVPERVSRFMYLYPPEVALSGKRVTIQRRKEEVLPSGTALGIVEIQYEDGVPVNAIIHRPN